uniref:IQ motif and ubiquitin-like domain-containing protein n=1 Tax=Clastoptera arizonana TaxID=38151 RepID=A0A1B6C025_9HEMI
MSIKSEENKYINNEQNTNTGGTQDQHSQTTNEIEVNESTEKTLKNMSTSSIQEIYDVTPKDILNTYTKGDIGENFDSSEDEFVYDKSLKMRENISECTLEANNSITKDKISTAEYLERNSYVVHESITDENMSEIVNIDEKYMIEKRILPLQTMIDSPSTDNKSPSLINKTDYIFEHPVTVNTHVQNTPNQEIVTAKFITDSNVTFAYSFNLSSTISEIKEQLSGLVGVHSKYIIITKDEYEVDDWLPLNGLGVEAFGCIELSITSTNPNQKISGIIYNDIPTTDVITVHILQEDGGFKDIIVEIKDEAYCKQWLGGYRNKKNGLNYHHASTQTLPKKKNLLMKLDDQSYEYYFFHRDTQTPFKPKKIGVDTSINKATQMYRTDCMIPSKNDKIITVKKFETYDEWLETNNVIEKVILIQRWVRNCIRFKKFRNLLELPKQAMQKFQDQQLKLLYEQVEKKRQMVTGAVFPSKRDDFYMLYLMVGKWWQKELLRIKDLRTDESKKAEFCSLLEKEIVLLSAIEKHKIEVKKESLRKQDMRFLDVVSRPITFQNTIGGMTSIDNPATQKAREFKELYCTLISDKLTPHERIDFLLTLKNIISTYKEYEYSKDIIILIEREINLHVIGLKNDELSGIQKRIEQLFMYFLYQPQFNPKAEKYRKANWPKTIDTLYKCTRCFKLLPVSGFPVHTRMEKITICKSCEWLRNVGHQRIDMSPYLKLLKQIQNSEMQKCCYSAVCFVLQQTGVYFLVNTIWHGHSALSESRDLSNLRLERWIKDLEWSPWNNILLTEEEAKYHNVIENVFEFYAQPFIDSVRQKHILARVHFISLLKTNYQLRSTEAWESITNTGPYHHPSLGEKFIQQDSDE